MKKISILGSTGSIGTQSLDVAKTHGYDVCGLAANSNIKLLEQQARQFLPRLVCIYDENCYHDLKIALSDTDIKIVTGIDGLCEVASMDEIDIVINSVVGMIGLRPTLAAIDAGKDIALANKETLVTGGKIVMAKAKEKQVKILPVDSEHSAIFQSIGTNRACDIKKIILTASGGPFFGRTKEELKNVTIDDALNHPNWSMGAKITIDSASMMNKGLELIEAVWLFNVPPSDIEIIVHKQSVIHSAVEFVDHSVIAQLGVPDMRIPIQYALTYPERYVSSVKSLSLLKYGTLSFFEPDWETFICLKAAKEAIQKGGLYPTLVNGANEQAVELFLKKQISFLEIGELVYSSLSLNVAQDDFTVEDIIKTDRYAREYVLSQVK
jgi:1-deoxy-D-xylulose-5-phosphate reductoisomerase